MKQMKHSADAKLVCMFKKVRRIGLYGVQKKCPKKNAQSVLTSSENYDNVVSYVNIPPGP